MDYCARAEADPEDPATERHMRKSLLLSIGCIVVVGSGCAGRNGQIAAAPHPVACDGDILLFIDNRSSSEIEVVELRSNTSGSAVAFLGPGVHTLPIATTRPVVYAARFSARGAWISWEGSRHGNGLVRFERRCGSDLE
jgi:hypothetical protein